MIAGRWRDRATAAAGLTVIWVLMWGSITPLTVVAGALIAAVVLIVFPLPPITYSGRIHPLGVLRLVTRFVTDLVVASAQVAVLAFRLNRTPRSAVIAVALRAPSDVGLTLTAEALSLVPGSLIVEVDRDRGILYVHVLGVADKAEADRFRQTVLDLERRIILAFGSQAERRLVLADTVPAVQVRGSDADRPVADQTAAPADGSDHAATRANGAAGDGAVGAQPVAQANGAVVGPVALSNGTAGDSPITGADAGDPAAELPVTHVVGPAADRPALEERA